ncbi:MAG: hypothetical protein LBU73_05670, partial [Helicobacteraceae bacterium]|jgi:hypothetical protein|nr:hypothetical protein [Helicobacteraceae bacterium]
MFSSVGHAFSGAAGAASGAASDRSAPGGHSLFSNLGVTYVGQKSSHNYLFGREETTQLLERGSLKGFKRTWNSENGSQMTEYNFNNGKIQLIQDQNGNFLSGSSIKGINATFKSDRIQRYTDEHTQAHKETEASQKAWKQSITNAISQIYEESKGSPRGIKRNTRKNLWERCCQRFYDSIAGSN